MEKEAFSACPVARVGLTDAFASGQGDHSIGGNLSQARPTHGLF